MSTRPFVVVYRVAHVLSPYLVMVLFGVDMCCAEFFLCVNTAIGLCSVSVCDTPQEEELSELGRGVMLYRRLGLEFEGGDLGEDGSMKCLRLVFRQVHFHG